MSGSWFGCRGGEAMGRRLGDRVALLGGAASAETPHCVGAGQASSAPSMPAAFPPESFTSTSMPKSHDLSPLPAAAPSLSGPPRILASFFPVTSRPGSLTSCLQLPWPPCGHAQWAFSTLFSQQYLTINARPIFLYWAL